MFCASTKLPRQAGQFAHVKYGSGEKNGLPSFTVVILERKSFEILITQVAHLTNFHVTIGIIKGGITAREERGLRNTE